MKRNRLFYICLVLWGMIMHDALAQNEPRVITMGNHSFVVTNPADYDRLSFQIDSVDRIIRQEREQALQQCMRDGFIPAGPLKIDYSKLIHYNAFEGWKYGAGLWTDTTLMRHLSVGGYWTYSNRRETSLWGAGAKYSVYSGVLSQLSLMYVHDNQATGVSEFIPLPQSRRQLNLEHYLTETMDLSRNILFQSVFRVGKRFQLALNYRNRDVSPQIPYRFMTGSEIVAPRFVEQQLGIQTSSLLFRSDAGNETGLQSNAWIGWGDELKNYAYQKYEVSLSQTFRWSERQVTSLCGRALILSGTDLPVAHYYSGLGSFKRVGVFVPYAFATMRMNEFAANRFFALFVEHAISLSSSANKDKIPICRLQFNSGIGHLKGIDDADVNVPEKGYAEGGVVFDNLMRLGYLRYGFAAFYRVGSYAFSSVKDNLAFQFVIQFK